MRGREEQPLTFIEHLAELRRRLIILVVSVLAGTILSYQFVSQITELVMRPAEGLQFVYLSPPELFLVYVKLSIVSGIILTLPITLGQVWLFLRPGLHSREKLYMGIALVTGVFFFVIGVFFAYLVILPLTIQFFTGITFPGVEPMFSVASYVGFITSILLSFGIVFEMPIVVVLLTQLNLLTAAGLKRNRKFIYLAIIVMAAVLSPPDLISQVLLGAPMMLLFELSVLVAIVIGRRKAKAE